MGNEELLSSGQGYMTTPMGAGPGFGTGNEGSGHNTGIGATGAGTGTTGYHHGKGEPCMRLQLSHVKQAQSELILALRRCSCAAKCNDVISFTCLFLSCMLCLQ